MTGASTDYILEQVNWLAFLIMKRLLRLNLIFLVLFCAIFLFRRVINRSKWLAGWNLPPVHRRLWMLLWIGPFCIKSRLFEVLADLMNPVSRALDWIEKNPLAEAAFFLPVIAMLLKRSLKGRRLRKGLIRTTPCADERGTFKTALLESGCAKKGIRVVVSDETRSPCTIGIFRPVIVLPSGYRKKFSESELFLIFLHELCHIKNHDLTSYRLTALLCDVFWFNLLFRKAALLLLEDAEKCCDYFVLSRTGGKAAPYGMVLLKALSGREPEASLFTAGLSSAVTGIKRRILAIAEYRAIDGGRLRVFQRGILAFTVILCMGSAVFSCFPQNLYRARAIYRNNTSQAPLTMEKEVLESIELTGDAILVDWRRLKEALAEREKPQNTAWIYIDLYETDELFTCALREIPADNPERYYKKEYVSLPDGRVRLPLYQNVFEKYYQSILKYL